MLRYYILICLSMVASDVFCEDAHLHGSNTLIQQLIDGPDREQAYIKLLENADPPAPWHTQRIDGSRTIKHVALCPQHLGPPVIAVFLDYPGVLTTRSTNPIQGFVQFITYEGEFFEGYRETAEVQLFEDLNDDGIMDVVYDVGYHESPVRRLDVVPVVRHQQPSLQVFYRGSKWNWVEDSESEAYRLHIYAGRPMSRILKINSFERDWKRVYAEFVWNENEGLWERTLPNANFDRVVNIPAGWNQYRETQEHIFRDLERAAFKQLDLSQPSPWWIDPKSRLSVGGEKSGFYWLAVENESVSGIRFKAAGTKEAIAVLSPARKGWGEDTLVFVIGSKQQSIRLGSLLEWTDFEASNKKLSLQEGVSVKASYADGMATLSVDGETLIEWPCEIDEPKHAGFYYHGKEMEDSKARYWDIETDVGPSY